MSTREMAYNLVDRMSEKQLAAFIELFGALGDFNDETAAVLDDVNNGRNLSRPFSSVSELMEELNAEN
ncbi:MAG: hypothetical protein J6C96_12450 [Oscillospiraceae bacterium]|nr:hypothetical protein [Oscillospiraceae bacterium]